jgi:hypothetical protein
MTALLKPFLDDALHGVFAKPETTAGSANKNRCIDLADRIKERVKVVLPTVSCPA